MRILSDLNSYTPDPSRPLVLGIGNFDGLHLGHQALLHYVKECAESEKGTAGVLTFRKHPQQVLHPEKKSSLLMDGDYKLFLFQELGVEVCFWLPFTEKFSQTEAETFVEKILVKTLRVQEVCMGYNAHFGHHRKGDAALMEKLAKKYGFGFKKIEPVSSEGDYVSSSRIRKLIKEGRLDQAAACLGHPLRFLAEVVTGEGRGKRLGYPTANLDIKSEVMPPTGVYPVKLRVLDFERKPGEKEGDFDLVVRGKGSWHEGVLNYGYRPTFREEGPAGQEAVAEAFLFDFEGDLCGRAVEVLFYKKLRDERRFESPEALKRQIQQDTEAAKKFFTAAPKGAIGNIEQGPST